MMITEDESYRQFTKPAELHKAVNTLRGLVAGMTLEEGFSDTEAMELTNWCAVHAYLQDRHPFSELIPVVQDALADGFLTEDESKDILWLCSNFVDDSKYYDVITSSIQFLYGMFHGIVSDGVLSDEEILKLRTWLENNDYLKRVYPFDEIDSLLYAVLSDGKISDDERNMLMAFFGTFIDFQNSWNLREADFIALREKYSVGGICAHCPDVSFEGKTFCFTGKSSVCDRSTIEDEIVELGGIVRSSVTKKTDFLVMGDEGNQCWTYTSYGRKVEDAIALRKAGARVTIVNEHDFWAAVTVAKGEKS